MVVSPVCWQILATLAAASSTFGWGCSIGLSATLISKLRHDEFGLSITDEDASWIGSCLAIGGAVGSLVTGFLMNGIGRKLSLILLTLVSIVGFSLTASEILIVICIGRVISGFSVGASVMVGTVYVSEISCPKWRGTLGSSLILCLTFGIIYIYIIGALLPGYPGSWKIFSVWCAVPQILGFILMILVPESPYYLIAKKRHSKATEVVELLNGKDDIVVQDVIKDIEKYLEQGKSSGNINSCDKHHISTKNVVPDHKNDEISKESNHVLLESNSENKNTEPSCENIDYKCQEVKGLIKIVMIVIGLFFFTRLCGISPISYYLVDILERGDVALDPEWSAVGVGIIETIGCLISTYLIDRVGRKSLLIVSGIGMGTFHTLIAWSFYQTENQNTLQHMEKEHSNHTNTLHDISNSSLVVDGSHDTNDATYLPLVGLVGFYLTFAIGTGSVPMVILGEVFPQSIKGTAISVINCCMWILNFTISKLFFFMNQHLGTYGTFIFFGTSSVAMSVYVFLFLPETKNKTLNQIQRKLQRRKNDTSS